MSILKLINKVTGQIVELAEAGIQSFHDGVEDVENWVRHEVGEDVPENAVETASVDTAPEALAPVAAQVVEIPVLTEELPAEPQPVAIPAEAAALAADPAAPGAAEALGTVAGE